MSASHDEDGFLLKFLTTFLEGDKMVRGFMVRIELTFLDSYLNVISKFVNGLIDFRC